MDTKFYLENVIFCLTPNAGAAAWEPLTEKLDRLGILMERVDPGREKPEKPEKEHTLYITDSGVTSQMLTKKGLPVLAYLHDLNRGENFEGVLYAMEDPEGIDPEYLERVYRRYYDLPWDILTTSRCVLRETVVEDVDAFVEIYSDPEITRYTEGLYPDPEEEKAYIRDYRDKIYRYYEYGVWTVLSKETGEVIGRAGFSHRQGYELPELGFVIATSHQGAGIATEICNAILHYGEEMLGFDRVQALVRPDNKISLALCRRLGFAETGRVREKDDITGEQYEYCYLEWHIISQDLTV